jgi:Zn-dependent alcohol dehydrogenase
MFDMTQPIQMEVIIGSIVFIFGLVGIGLAAVTYYKNKLDINKDK